MLAVIRSDRERVLLLSGLELKRDEAGDRGGVFCSTCFHDKRSADWSPFELTVEKSHTSVIPGFEDDCNGSVAVFREPARKGCSSSKQELAVCAGMSGQ